MQATSLSEQLSIELSEPTTVEIDGVGSLVNAGKHQLTYANGSRLRDLRETSAGLVIAKREHASYAPCPVLISENPRLDFARALNILYPEKEHIPLIHSTAIIGENVVLGENISIGPYTIIDENVVIGANTIIESHCRIKAQCTIGESNIIASHCVIGAKTTIGSNCKFESGVNLGAEGFGFVADEHSKWFPIKQLSHVIIGDDVYLGSYVCIDRGALEPTIIGNGVKIDNHVQVGHGVNVGENAIISGCASIGGSTIIGKRCMIGGDAAIRDNIHLVDDVMISGAGVVMKSIEKPGAYTSVFQVQPSKKWMRNLIHFNNLDTLVRKFRTKDNA